MALTTNLRPGLRGLGSVALAESLLVLPATALLAASAIRMLQPVGREPAHTIGLLADWSLSHATPLTGAVLLIAMPAAALLVGAIALRQRWAADQQLRDDARELVALARRQAVNAILVAGAITASAILAAVVIHLITD